MIGAIVIGGDYQGLGIVRSLGRAGIPVYVLDWQHCISKVSKYTKKFFHCPDEIKGNEFLSFLINLSRECLGWLIYPITDETVKLLSKNKDILENYYKIWLPEWNVVEKLYNKKLTYELAEKLNIPIPKTFYTSNLDEIYSLNLSFPVIIKPTFKGKFYRKTKKKAIKANNMKELIKIYKLALKYLEPKDIMIQEVIKDVQNNLFSYCCLFKNKKAIAGLSAKRIRQHPVEFGKSSTYVVGCNIPEIKELTIKLLSEINYYGLAEAEFVYDVKDRSYKLLEVNPRTWGWHTIGKKIGYDFPLLLYKDFLGEEITNNYVNYNNIKWVRIITDLPIVIKKIISGKLSLFSYFYEITNNIEYAVLSKDDILPFFFEIILLPYLWFTRGY